MTAWKTPKTGKHVSSLHTRKTPTNANGATAAASSTPVSASTGSGSGPGAATPPIGAKGKENIFPDLKTRKRVPERLNYEELQANEIIVLESAYFDNFRRLDEGHSAWKKTEPSFEIRLVSNIDADFALTLHVVFTATYPRSPPLLTVKDHSTLRPAALFKVQKYIETEPRNHVHEDEMMMTIALGIEEILNTAAQAKLDGNERSLELERADHEARLAERAQLIEQEANKRRLQEQEEEKQAWARQLQDEKKRQTESSKKMLRQRGSLASALNSAKNTSVKHEPDLAFDQLCAVKDASGNTNSFLSVAEKTPFKDGSVSKLSKVRPILIEGRHAPSLLLKETMVRCSGKTASQAQDQIQHLEQKLIKLQEMSHPRIVELLAYKIERDRAIQDTPTWNVSILTPLAERGSLEELLELTGSLNIVKVRAWTRDLLDALSYLHNRGIIHQDIHPRNVLLFRDERTNDVGLKLADISYQREFHNINDQNKSLPGVGSARSAYWLAPELAIDTRATPTQKSDVWDFGVVFLQLIFGLDVPLKHTSPTSLQESMDLSPPLRELVSRFFKSNAKKRPRAFELSSSEFLATDAPVMARDVPPMPDISTIATLSSSIPTRLRRDSMTRGLTQSRYAEDFVEEGLLGKGAFGQVVKARKKLDGQFYAIKKVTQRSHASLTETLKEVRLLSRISHPAVVRYYNTWVEEVPDISDISSSASADDASELSDIEEDSHSQASQASGHTISAAPNVVFEASKSGLDFISTSQPDVIFGYDTDDEDAHKECEEEEEEEEEDEVEDEEDEETTEDDGDDNAIESDEYDDHETDSVTSSNRPGRGTSKVKSMPIRIPARKANAVFHNAPPSASASASRHPFRTILYISMEYCDQRTLRYLIARNIYTHPNKVWRLFRQILEGLAHIHALRIVHRDLKPENIFISQGDDGLDNVKIGDFGLATSGHFVVDKRANDSQVLADMGTKSIGTAFYAAPEVRSAARGSYSSKVDMYSLGLIFFEMCTSPCESVMERIQVTESLRQIPPVLPDTRIPTDKVQQGIILSLLTHDPETRPSAGELLKSGLLPVQMEGEAIKRALAGISDPNSQYYEGMLQTIFARPVEAIKDYNWASISSNSSPDPKSILAQSVARATLGEIFRRHGALEVSKAEIYPRARNYYPDNSTVYCVLGPNGTVLQMPFDLTLGHARFLATYPGAVASRTYAFGSVFRNRLANAPPEITGEVDFDIVTTDSLDLALKEAETIKVLDEIAAAFPRLAQGKIRIMISHSQILQTIFDYCKVDKSSRRAAAQILTSLNIGRVTFNSLRTQLRDPSVGVSATSVDGLARFDWTGQPNAALSQLKALLNDDDTNYYRQLLPTIAHIKEVLEYCKRLKVKTKIHIHPLGAIKEDFYTDGIMFSLISEDGPKQVLAAGGRYDALIKAHRPKMVVSGGGGLQERHAVGFSLAWERLTRVQKPVNKFKKKASRMAATEDMLSISSSRCDVLVVSFDPELLRSAGLEILHTLWAHNIGAELASDARTTEELMTRYRDDSVSWLVIVKPEQLKIKSLWTKDVPDVEMSVSAVQLIVYLRAEMREKDSKAASKVKNVVAQQQQSAELGTGSGQRGGREQGVVVLVAQTRSKKFNRLNVIEQANAGAAALTKSFLEGRILAIETQDRVVQLVSETALSDAESWRRVEQAVPMNERSYMREVHATLEDFRSEFLHAQGSRHAFIFNFRTGLTIYYDLGR